MTNEERDYYLQKTLERWRNIERLIEPRDVNNLLDKATYVVTYYACENYYDRYIYDKETNNFINVYDEQDKIRASNSDLSFYEFMLDTRLADASDDGLMDEWYRKEYIEDEE